MYASWSDNREHSGKSISISLSGTRVALNTNGKEEEVIDLGILKILNLVVVSLNL